MLLYVSYSIYSYLSYYLNRYTLSQINTHPYKSHTPKFVISDTSVSNTQS